MSIPSIRFTMKTPDALESALETGRANAAILGTDFDEEHAKELLNRWLEYGEYLQVELDLKTGECKVLPV